MNSFCIRFGLQVRANSGHYLVPEGRELVFSFYAHGLLLFICRRVLLRLVLGSRRLHAEYFRHPPLGLGYFLLCAFKHLVHVNIHRARTEHLAQHFEDKWAVADELELELDLVRKHIPLHVDLVCRELAFQGPDAQSQNHFGAYFKTKVHVKVVYLVVQVNGPDVRLSDAEPEPVNPARVQKLLHGVVQYCDVSGRNDHARAVFDVQPFPLYGTLILNQLVEEYQH